MNGQLWKSFWEDDVDRFSAVLHGQKGGTLGQAGLHAHGSSASWGQGLSVSPNASFKTRHAPDKTPPALRPQDRPGPDASLTRAEINRRDAKGLTLLHHAASLTTESALAFTAALLNHPLVDLYAQDLENGWTSLHRALYFGNISIARSIIERESHILPGQMSLSSLAAPPSLIKIKDKEGLAPYDLLSATIIDRTLRHSKADYSINEAGSANDDHDDHIGSPERGSSRTLVGPLVDVDGDDLFTFGSNRNFSLGLGDGDDRQFPERIVLRRPHHLFKKFHSEHSEHQAEQAAKANAAYAERLRDRARVPQSTSDLPSVIRSRPVSFKDVQMAKFHTAVLTDDPYSNLYLCGHGPGGRLGLGNETTQFNFVCLEDFGSSRKKIAAVALGQDHTLAVTDQGELFTWGSNFFGQLGSGLPKENAKPEECVQLSPKQLFGPLKREAIVGVAASRIHSVAYTLTALYTFGKNEGQLGLVDSQAGTLKIQATPRQVQASRLSCAIHSVSAIDRATICLLENNEVHVFANYGAVKLQFPLDGFANYFLGGNLNPTNYNRTPNKICKVTSGGDTICALSTSGEVFTVNVNQRLDPGSASTTNPNKIRAALSTPFHAWSLRTDRMMAKDVGVDSDGSIILSTSSGSVWRRVRRAKLAGKASESKTKDFKFMRVPNLTRAVAVRASASGSYAAIRQECDLIKAELNVSAPTLWTELFGLLPLKGLSSDADFANPAPVFWQRPSELKKLVARLSQCEDVEDEVKKALRKSHMSLKGDLLVRTSASDTVVPVHSFILTGRSPVFRGALGIQRGTGVFENEYIKMSSDEEGQVTAIFLGLDFLTLVELVLWFYTDSLVGFWQYTQRSPQLAYRYRQVRNELIKIASRLELQSLESAARRMINSPEQSMHADMELALLDQSFFSTGDTMIQLSDGELIVHSALMAKRCPFFEGLFEGQAGGRWLSQRRSDDTVESSDYIQVDLSHIELAVFKLVLRHLYADTGVELFDGIVSKDLDEFLDIVMEVLSVANELMLDRLSLICQTVLGRHVSVRNACQLLNAVAPCSVPDLKNSILEYLCLNLETVLTNHWLDELEEELLLELDAIVRDNQLAALPFARSGEAERQLHERNPELADMIERNKRAKLDAVVLQGKYPDINTPISKSKTSPVLRGKTPSANTSPTVLSKSPSAKAELAMATLEPLPSPATAELPPARTIQSPERAAPAASSNNEKPWGSSSMPSTKLSMMDIMSQASSSRASNISLGLQSQPNTDRKPSLAGPPTTPKISQKERKRQQQQLQQPPGEGSPMHSPSLAGSAPGSGSPSAWKTVAPPKKSTLAETSLQSPVMTRKASTPESRSPATPQLTMRQTVANTTQKSPTQPVNVSNPPPQRRSVSSPQMPNKGPANDGPGMAIGSSTAIAIQSVRHTPKPDRLSSPQMRASLADIISQEQAVKDVVRDSVAKRSLQEIQEEQAFQEWWDQESKAVQEEAAAAAQVSQSTRGRGGRRGPRSKRGGKQRAEPAHGA